MRLMSHNLKVSNSEILVDQFYGAYKSVRGDKMGFKPF